MGGRTCQDNVAMQEQAAINLVWARRLWGTLVELGLRHVVICPGSRSGPLSLAADLTPGLNLFSSIDERSAGFFALGLGRAGLLPVAVVTTSGTAVANLLPAAVEADRSGLPLLLLSADRPQRLKNCGANQTVNQEAFLQPACRCMETLPQPGAATALPLGEDPLTGLHRPLPQLQRPLHRAWAALLGDGVRAAGPVHLNQPLEEPLHADGATIAALRAEADATALPAAEPTCPAPPPVAGPVSQPFPLDPDRSAVIVVGPSHGDQRQLAADLRQLVNRTGWPVLADAASGLRGRRDLPLVHGYDLLLPRSDPGFAPDQVLRLGGCSASRHLQDWLRQLAVPQVQVMEGDDRNWDPLGSVTLRRSDGLAGVLRALPHGAPAAAALALGERWRRADQQLQRVLDGACSGDGPLQEPCLARDLDRLLPSQRTLMLANSSAVRDWESFSGGACPRRVVSFRGASGIDGTLSLAFGLASHGDAVLLSGDLALLHDSNGWLWAESLRRIGHRLLVVLIDNGGGGIFEQLPIRQEGVAMERLFTMGQVVDPCTLAAAHGVPSRVVVLRSDLDAAVAWGLSQPLALLQCCSDARADAALRQRLRRRQGSDRSP